jgi:predicted acyltransferase (DUF342 family)
MIRPLVFGVFVGMAALTSACGSASDDENGTTKVLGSVHIPPGQHIKDATTVNGSVEVGENAVVDRANTVNGSITLRQHATAASVETVNGSARLEAGARVGGGVELVNGRISLGDGADVTGRLTTVNGSIQLSAAHVGGGIQTKNGDIEIGPNSRVEGGILIRSTENSWFNFGSPKIPRVVVGAGAVVQGTLRFEREVKLYVNDTAQIGTVEGATVIKFSGAQPPG